MLTPISPLSCSYFTPLIIYHIWWLNFQPHYNTDCYTPYPKYRPWSRPMHSLMAVHHLDSCMALWLFACCLPHVHLMSIPCIALWLSTSWTPHAYHMFTSWSPHAYLMEISSPCISHSLASRHLMYFISASSPLYHPYLSSCSPHVSLMLSLMYSSWLTLVL